MPLQVFRCSSRLREARISKMWLDRDCSSQHSITVTLQPQRPETTTDRCQKVLDKQYAICHFPLSPFLCQHSSVFYYLTLQILIPSCILGASFHRFWLLRLFTFIDLIDILQRFHHCDKRRERPLGTRMVRCIKIQLLGLIIATLSQSLWIIGSIAWHPAFCIFCGH